MVTPDQIMGLARNTEWRVNALEGIEAINKVTNEKLISEKVKLKRTINYSILNNQTGRKRKHNEEEKLGYKR